MLSGHIYDGESLQISKRVLTWHDESQYRYWVGSCRAESGNQVIQSFEIQLLDLNPELPSSDELRIRLRLISNNFENANALSASEFRRLPLGEILMERAQHLMARMQYENKRSKSVVLLKENSIRNSNRKTPRKSLHESAISGANSDDAILVAKIYVDQCNMSNVRAAQRTAEYLSVESNLIHVALKIARRNGWLTSVGSGKAGGQLTEIGLTEFALSNGAEREKRINKNRGMN